MLINWRMFSVLFFSYHFFSYAIVCCVKAFFLTIIYDAYTFSFNN